MSSTAAPQPPPVRRVITGHAPDGKAIFADDAPVRSYPFKDTTTVMTDLYRADGYPSSNNGGFGDAIGPCEDGLVNPGGGFFRIVDMPPHTETVGADTH